MWFIRASVVGPNAFSKLTSGEQSVGFNNRPFPMDPFGFNGIEPRALLGQQKGQETHAFVRLLHLPVVFSDPGAHLFANMPGRVIPDQQPGRFAQIRQALRAPLEKLRGNVTHGTARDKAQPHLVPLRLI